MGNLKKNIGYQTLYQILNTILPLITAPYLARTLGASAQGIASYTQSIVNYFTLIAILGVTNYGTRAVSTNKKSIQEISNTFWNIYIIQFIASTFAILMYGLYLFLLCKENVLVSAIQALYLLGSLADINWLFFGVEKFKTTVSRNIIIRVISVLLILCLVRHPSDLWIYVLIMGGSVFLSNIVLWRFAVRIVDFSPRKYVNLNAAKAHVKPICVLFVPVLLMSFYHIMDKTMLGMLSSYEQTGFYYNADKVINIPMGIIGGISTVMLPRMSAILADKNDKDYESLYNLSTELIFAAACGMAFGISAISREFTPLFFGDGFDPCISLIITLSPVLVFRGLAQTTSMQYLIPKHKEKVFITASFWGIVTNLIVNIILIPRFGALGAVAGTVCADFVTCSLQYYLIRKEYPALTYMVKELYYVGFGTIMYITVRFISHIIHSNVVSIIAEISAGAFVYLSFCILLWHFTNAPFFKTIKRRIIR